MPRGDRVGWWWQGRGGKGREKEGRRERGRERGRTLGRRRKRTSQEGERNQKEGGGSEREANVARAHYWIGADLLDEGVFGRWLRRWLGMEVDCVWLQVSSPGARSHRGVSEWTHCGSSAVHC